MFGSRVVVSEPDPIMATIEGKMKRIYLDHAATTPVHPKVLEAMLPYFSEKYGNPSPNYSLAIEARTALIEARETVAKVLCCSPEEIIFTSGGTESDNAAIKGSAFALKGNGNHIITSGIEHHAVLHAFQDLENSGFEVTVLPVNHNGMINLRELEEAITERTTLVSIMLANNEVGTILPMVDISKSVHQKNPHTVLHTDAVQAVGTVVLDVNTLGIDMMSLSAHKFYGPKGVGILYVRNGIPFMPQQLGGAQEGRRRAGTENIVGIVGTAVALKLAIEHQESNRQHCQRLRDRLIKGIRSSIDRAYLNGHPAIRLANNVNFSFEDIKGESILFKLDDAGIVVSRGSACASGFEEPSHILLALGLSKELALGAVRFSLGPENDEDEIDYLLSILPDIVQELRTSSTLISPD